MLNPEAKLNPNRNGFAPIIIIIAIALAAAIAGYFVVKTKKAVSPVVQEPPAQLPTPTATAPTASHPTSTTIDISTWQTYRNPKYGFEVKYPADFEASASSTEYIEFFTAAQKDRGIGSVTVTVHGVPPGSSWESAVVGNDTDFYSRTTFQGGPAYEFLSEIKCSDGGQCETPTYGHNESISFPSSDHSKFYRVELGVSSKNYNTYNANLAIFKNVYDQILSTFRFIPSTESQSSQNSGEQGVQVSLADLEEGKFCGGTSALPCSDGYSCKFVGNFPNAFGQCAEDNPASIPQFIQGLLKTSAWTTYHSVEDGYEIRYPKELPYSEAVQLAVGSNLLSELPGKDFGTAFLIPHSFADFRSAWIQIGANPASACEALVGSGTDMGIKIIGGKAFKMNELVDSGKSNSYIYNLYSIKNEDTCYILNLGMMDLRTHGEDYAAMTGIVEKMLGTLNFVGPSSGEASSTKTRMSCC